MAEYLSPGVYVEEVDAGPKPIEGVSTSTAGAVGVTARGPTSGKPVLVTSFADYQRTFGGFLPDPDAATLNLWNGNQLEGGRWWQFPLAVRAFFDNGGQRLYVKRVFTGGGLPAAAQNAANTAVASNGNFQAGLVAEIESDATASANPVAFTVHHLVGISIGTAVTLRNGQTGQAIGGAFAVARYDPTSRRVQLNNPLPPNTDVSAGRGDLLVITAPAAVAGANTPLAVRAKARGEWGDALRVRIRPMFGATLALLNDPVNGGAAARAAVLALAPGAAAADPWTVTVQPAAAGAPPALTGFGAGDRVVVMGREYLILAAPVGDTFQIAAQPAGTIWPPGTRIQRLRPARAPGAGVNQLRVWGATRLYDNAVVELDNGRQKEVLRVAAHNGDLVTLSGPLANDYWEGQSMRVVELELDARYQPDGRIDTEETFSNLRPFGNAGDASYIVTAVNAGSALIELDDGGNPLAPAPLANLPVAQSGRWLDLANGDDRLDLLSVDDLVGIDGGSGNRTGIQALEDIDEISICLAPGIWSRTVHNALIQHCETLKDRFAIVDPRDRLDVEGIRSFREIYDTKYAALYYPWLEVRDPSKQSNVRMAPSGHIAGVYARVDVERGVHKAPANEVIRAISGIAEDVNKREHDMLNPKNINVLRFFPGRGNRVWGARCLTSDSAWKYVNVRRFFIYVEESIDEGTQWVVFEPNDEPTWARVRLSISNFLNSEWRKGALQGRTAAEAYFVKCDLTTMTQDDIDNGRLICVVGIAPVKPAEFVIFRIQQKTLDTKQA